MITLRRANERHHERRGKREVWHTFLAKDEASALPFAEGFGILVRLDEHALPPGADVPRAPPGDAELITYVHEGGLACEDSTGRSGIIQAGEFQHMNLARSFRFKKTNSSQSDWAHVYQLGLSRSEISAEARYEQKRFSAAERRGALRAVATPDARKGSLTTAGALLYSAILSPGKHVVYELSTGQNAWLHVVLGDLTLGSVILGAGDGAGIEEERSISLTARKTAEILVCDLGECRSQTRNAGPVCGTGD